MNTYATNRNNLVVFFDVLGREPYSNSPYPGTGVPYPSSGAASVKDEVREQNRLVASWVGKSKAPECELSSECSKISIVIALPDPRKPHPSAYNPGHAGLGIDNEFLDFGPWGPHWSATYQTMDDLGGFIRNAYSGKGNVIAYEFCACKKNADIARSIMEDYQDSVQYSWKHPCNSCSAAVVNAVGWMRPYSTPNQLARDIGMLMDGLIRHTTSPFLNQCGPRKGESGNVRWLSAMKE